MTLLFDAAVKATPILLAAWLATGLLRRASADLRHRIWLAAILAVAILPAITPIAPRALPASMRIVVSAGSIAAASHAMRFPWMFTIWMAGAMAILARLAIGHAVVARRGDRVATPMTWGIFRPVIAIPSYMREWSGEQMEIVLRHEQAHIARRDWLWQTIARLVAAVFWFHPLIWLADAALRREAERAADDRVLAGGTDAFEYAAQLARVARRMHKAAPVSAVAMARRGRLEARVRDILDASRNRSRAGFAPRLIIAATAAALLLPLAAIGQQSHIYRIGEDGVLPPRVLTKVEPQYTPEARDEKIEGRTTLRMVIDEQGRAQNIEVAKSLDDGLDGNATDAIAQWQFAPGTKAGRPVAVYATVEVNFHLK